MRDPVLVVGAGLAGLAAATELARAGLRAIVADQARAPGGAIHRQPLSDVEMPIASPAQQRRWTMLMEEVKSQGERIEIRCASRYAGIDHQGMALLTGERSCLLRPSALVLATGATERVHPRPGWTLPGVMTAGAIQIQTKTLGAAPQGRILLAGSGPLLLAAAANMVDGGNPPVAVIEAARPFSHAAALALPGAYLREAAGYMATLLRARVPLLTGADLVRIEQGTAGLRAIVGTSRGARTFEVDVIGLHDGIRPNDYGATNAPVPVLRAGDCREALGARAALADG
ncbi:MAG: FAD/NAD(P)-binding oxidoreductase, partial [Oricola sp.]